MRCAICNSTLGETEVKFNKLHDEFDPCGTCLEVIENVFEDYVPEHERKDFDDEEDFGDGGQPRSEGLSRGCAVLPIRLVDGLHELEDG